MNWDIVIFAAMMIIAGLAFVIHARKTYDGPAAKVQKLEQES